MNLLHKLRHPQILSLVAAYQSPTHLVHLLEYIFFMKSGFYIIDKVTIKQIILTELLSGGELFEKVAADNFELTEAEVVVFMRGITEGAKYIHQQV